MMMEMWGITDRGLVRAENQDAFACRELAGHAVCVVCDGMGGPAGGRLASEIAARVYMEELAARLQTEMSPRALLEASAQAAGRANREIRRAAASRAGYDNMGTTLVAAVSYPGGAAVTNVGDSRAYYIGPDGVVQITRDHSVVQELVDRGDLTPQEARVHPNRNIITRALGPDDPLLCDGFLRPMDPGSWLLLCSDGLVGTVSDREMGAAVREADGGEAALQRLLALALDRGAPDNVTVVLMRNAGEDAS